jgi:hypothetical protein
MSDQTPTFENIEMLINGEPLFKEEFSRKDIARRLMNDFPGRWKDIESLTKNVGSVIRELKIEPIKKVFAGYRDDGQPKEQYIYSYGDANTIYHYVAYRKADKSSDPKGERMHVSFGEGEIHFKDSTDIGKQAMQIINEEVARTGKRINVVAAEMIIGYRTDHPIELSEEDKLRIENKRLRDLIKKYEKGEKA